MRLEDKSPDEASVVVRDEVVYRYAADGTGVRTPNGTVVETPATDTQDQPAQVTQLAPMYSDLHMKQLPVRSLGVGDTLEFETKITQKQAEVPGEFWGAESFGTGLVYLDRLIELRVPKGKTVTVYSPNYPAGDDREWR